MVLVALVSATLSAASPGPPDAPVAPVAAATATAAPAAPVTEPLDDQARFLAGLSVPDGSPLKPLEEHKGWQTYAKNLETDWTTLRHRRLDKMMEWSATELRPKVDLDSNLLYLFGGPDFLSVSALYPEAPVYVLAGLEPIGRVPNLASLTPAQLNRSIENLRKSLNSIVRSSFFKTNDMAGDLTRTELKGVLPLLYLFVARADAELLEVTFIEVNEMGEERALGEGEKPGKSSFPGVRLRFQRAGQERPQALYYVLQNIENKVVQNVPGFFAFLTKFLPANGFLKAASFLLHKDPRFTLARDFLLDHCSTVLQDDSGVPFRAFPKDKWTFVFYGKYLRPLPPFQRRLQEDLQKAFESGPVQPLPFVTGYRLPGQSNLLLALRVTDTPREAGPPGPSPPPPAPTTPPPVAPMGAR